MNPVATIPAHSLMFQKQSGTGSHSIHKQGNATQSAFAQYAFGPIDTGNRAKTSVQPVNGSFQQAAQQSMPWIAQLQGK